MGSQLRQRGLSALSLGSYSSGTQPKTVKPWNLLAGCHRRQGMNITFVKCADDDWPVPDFTNYDAVPRINIQYWSNKFYGLPHRHERLNKMLHSLSVTRMKVKAYAREDISPCDYRLVSWRLGLHLSYIIGRMLLWLWLLLWSYWSSNDSLLLFGSISALLSGKRVRDKCLIARLDDGVNSGASPF